MSKKLVILEKTNNFYTIRTVVRNSTEPYRCRGKSNYFFLCKEVVEKALTEDMKPFYDQDGSNFARIISYAEIISITITWLTPKGDGHFLAFRENIVLPRHRVIEWLNSGEVELKILDLEYGKHTTAKIIFTESANEVLRNVLKNRTAKRSLLNHLKRMSNYGKGSTITFYRDVWDDKSFYWTLHRGGRYVMNGGLIYRSRLGEYTSHT